MLNALDASRNWVERVVIAHNFCPFAKKEFEQKRIHFQLCEAEAVEDALKSLIEECERLDNDAEIETSLLVYTELLNEFDDFLDFVEIANQLLEMQQYDGVYQLANFHPDYCFDGTDINDAANYTNRSPYPMLHLIRELSMEKAVADYPDPASIPENNIIRARELGKAYFDKLIQSCGKSDKAK